MIRSRALKRIKRKTPSGKMVIHLKKHSKKHLLNLSPKIKREKLKAKVRK